MRRRAMMLIPLAFWALSCGDVTLTGNQETTGILDVSLGEIAVVTGDYERVEELLTQVGATYTLVDGYINGSPGGSDYMEYPAEMAAVEDFLSSADMLLYDTLFLNCGMRGVGAIDPVSLEAGRGVMDRADVQRNLRNFVAKGGVVYVSDQSYGLIEAAMPELLDFRGADEAVAAALQGAEAVVVGSVLDETLVSEVGPQVELELTEKWAMVYPTEGAWVTTRAPVRLGEGEVRVVDDTPLIVRRDYGEGQVIFSSYHNSAKVSQVHTQLQIQMLRAMGGAF